MRVEADGSIGLATDRYSGGIGSVVGVALGPARGAHADNAPGHIQVEPARRAGRQVDDAGQRAVDPQVEAPANQRSCRRCTRRSRRSRHHLTDQAISVVEALLQPATTREAASHFSTDQVVLEQHQFPCRSHAVMKRM